MRRIALVIGFATVSVLAGGPAANAAGIANTGDVRVAQVQLSSSKVHPGTVFTITIRSESKGPSSSLWDQTASVPLGLVVIGTECDLGISADGTFCEYGADPDPHLGDDLTTIYTVQVLTEGAVLGPADVTLCAASEEGEFIDRNPADNCKSKTITVTP